MEEAVQVACRLRILLSVTRWLQIRDVDGDTNLTRARSPQRLRRQPMREQQVVRDRRKHVGSFSPGAFDPYR